jgi:transcriptional regulator with XRE-family HTH domain
MYLQHVINIMYLRGLNGAQLARRCHVSRAAVTKWFSTQEDFINVETQTARTIAQVLGVPLARLFEPLEMLSRFETSFLWDSLYPSMETFVRAVLRGDRVAMARFVQVAGFFKAEAVFGKKIVSAFPKYKQFIKPARRNALETIWPLLASTH